MEIEIGGAEPGEFDTVVVEGAATLNGTLEFSLIDAAEVNAGDTFEILTAIGGVNGVFEFTDTVTSNGSTLIPTYRDGSVVVVASPKGDFDLDGDVDIDDVDDFVLGLTDPDEYTFQFGGVFPLERGDFFADGVLDVDDIPGFVDALPGDMTVEQILAMLAVPEPSTFTLVLLGLIIVFAGGMARSNSLATLTPARARVRDTKQWYSTSLARGSVSHSFGETGRSRTWLCRYSFIRYLVALSTSHCVSQLP